MQAEPRDLFLFDPWPGGRFGSLPVIQGADFVGDLRKYLTF